MLNLCLPTMENWNYFKDCKQRKPRHKLLNQYYSYYEDIHSSNLMIDFRFQSPGLIFYVHFLVNV